MDNRITGFGVFVLAGVAAISFAASETPLAMDNGERLLFFDGGGVAKTEGCSLRLNQPTWRNIVLSFDAPWEGNVCSYYTIFRDGEKARMYYRGAQSGGTFTKGHPEFACYAESADGIHWSKPNFGWVGFNGSTSNNILRLIGKDGKTEALLGHNFSPFRDNSPACKPEERYKALDCGREAVCEKGLYAFASADGLTWRAMGDKPVLTKGAFDSLNLSFWNEREKQYVSYYRTYPKGFRGVARATSPDYLHWSDPVNVPLEPQKTPIDIYTSGIHVYARAPRYYIGLSMRYNRHYVKDEMLGSTDCGFLASRDGLRFRLWEDALQRPGPMPSRWVTRNSTPACGTLITKSDVEGFPDEISFYTHEDYYSKTTCNKLRRFTVRLDGFVSLHAPAAGGTARLELMSLKPGKGRLTLSLNASTSAFPGIRCAVLQPDGKAFPGLSMEESVPFIGDSINATMKWKNGDDLSVLRGQTFQLEFELKDADLYSLVF